MTEQHTPPPVVRKGPRACVYCVPQNSPYATRLRQFRATWDAALSYWWVGITRANDLEQLLALPLGSPIDEPPPPQAEQRSIAALLVDMACDDFALGVTNTGEPFGVRRDPSHLALMLRGGRTGLRAELAHQFFETYQTPAPQQALADACMVLEGKAAQQDPQRVHLRIAEHDGAVFLDMGDQDGGVISIRDGQWVVEKTAPVLFRRTKLTGEMPDPATGGGYLQLEKLWQFVPVPADDRPLVLAWLVQALIQSDVPHPVLALIAEHGSIKSSSARALVALTDPSAVPVRKAPRDAEGWVTAANASWVVALDNISGEIPVWLSDCLCRAATGDGDVRRQLYTDSDVSVVAFRRAVIINGIDIAVTQGDLADRLLRVSLPRLKGGRKAEKVIAARWESQWPNIFGGLLDLAAKVHHLLPSITVENLPRMADFANVLAGVDKVCRTAGLERYQEQAMRVTAETLDHPFLNKLIDTRYSCDKTPSSVILAYHTIDDKSWKAPKGWPESPRAVTSLLTRSAPAMRMHGWTIEHDDGRNENHRLLWTLRPPETARKPGSSHSSGSPEDDNARSEGMW